MTDILQHYQDLYTVASVSIAANVLFVAVSIASAWQNRARSRPINWTALRRAKNA